MKNLCIIACIPLLFFVSNTALAQQAEAVKGYKFTEVSLKNFLNELQNELTEDGEEELTDVEQALLDDLDKKLKDEVLDNEYSDMEKVDVALTYTLSEHLAYKSKLLKHVEKLGINMGKIVDILVTFLVLAVVFEMAFSTLFEWKYFQEHLDNKGLKTPIMLILVFLIFGNYKLDIFTDLIVVLVDPKASSGLLGKIATAFLIAGGSKGIWQIFNRLGVRNPYTSYKPSYDPPYKKTKS